MKLLSTIGSTVSSAWFASDAATLEPLRAAMLAPLGHPVAAPLVLLHSRIRHAADVERLWYLRGGLMEALAELHGESHAASELARITELFEAHLPQGLADGVARRRAA